MDQKPDDAGEVNRSYGAGYGIVTAGFQLVFSILFFMWVGWLVDRWLKTNPWFMLVGLGLGLVAGFYMFMVKVSAAAKGGGSGDRGTGGQIP